MIKRRQLLQCMVLLAMPWWLMGCAHSDVSRHAAEHVDHAIETTKGTMAGLVNGDIAETYGNASQTTKGGLIGGAAGTLAGVTTGLGVLPGLATGVMLGASYGGYIDSKATPADKLQNRGAMVMTLGDHILIMLPSERLFANLSSRIKPQAYSTLHMVANYIRPYTKMLVKVSAYSNSLGSPDANLNLTQQQANQVAKVLHGYGVDARLIYAKGYGGTHLIEPANRAEGGSTTNYRVVITLQKYHV